MTFIDRYLGAIGANLPRRQRDDILRELGDDLRTRAEERAATLGRPLTEDEEADLLREMGEPMAVAARYRADDRGLAFGRRLIGPELFPSYLRVLGINLAITLVVGAILAFAGLRDGFVGVLFGLAVTFAIQFFIVTGIFVAIDRRYVARPDDWDPHADPGGYSAEAILDDLVARRPDYVSRKSSAVSLAWLSIVLAWWLIVPGLVMAATPFEPGPGWTAVSTAILGLFVIWFAQPIVNLVRPDWWRFRSAMGIIGDGATVVVALVALAIGDWLVLDDPAAAPAELVELERVIEAGIGIAIAAVVIVAALSIVGEIRRLRRRSASA